MKALFIGGPLDGRVLNLKIGKAPPAIEVPRVSSTEWKPKDLPDEPVALEKIIYQIYDDCPLKYILKKGAEFVES